VHSHKRLTAESSGKSKGPGQHSTRRPPRALRPPLPPVARRLESICACTSARPAPLVACAHDVSPPVPRCDALRAARLGAALSARLAPVAVGLLTRRHARRPPRGRPPPAAVRPWTPLLALRTLLATLPLLLPNWMLQLRLQQRRRMVATLPLLLSNWMLQRRLRQGRPPALRAARARPPPRRAGPHTKSLLAQTV
jgi:hypothetical protein